MLATLILPPNTQCACFKPFCLHSSPISPTTIPVHLTELFLVFLYHSFCPNSAVRVYLCIGPSTGEGIASLSLTHSFVHPHTFLSRHKVPISPWLQVGYHDNILPLWWYVFDITQIFHTLEKPV